MTRKKLRELRWEVLMYPTYSPNLTPTFYHLFMSMDNAIGRNDLACGNWLSKFFANTNKGFYEKGIMKLDSRW
uniref:Putative LOC101460606 [Ceratitis capitata] n=1 Tax=Lepeophtheirus salmonis TaxID=72036 RepID=A0A0K2TET0_LEPSM